MEYPKTIEFKGTIYRLQSERGYYRSRTQGKYRLLHKEVWKDTHGEIPEGCVIHHKDCNKLNNSIENNLK